MSPITAATAALAALLVAGCAGTGGGNSAGEVLMVGDNAVGEPCRLAGGAGKAPGGMTRVYKLLCGDWEEPSATLFAAKADDAEARGWWNKRLDSFAACSPAKPTQVLGGEAAEGIDCRLRAGGWPYQALTTRIGSTLWLADAIPAAMPALETAIGHLSGRRPIGTAAVGTTEASREMARLQARIASASYSVGDISSYNDLLKLAQYHNFQGEHAEAERLYRKALAIHQKVLPDQVGERSLLYMNIALEGSNQGRFDAADVLFDQASQDLHKALDPTLAARLASYRALHLANQRRNLEAVQMARQATILRQETAIALGYGGVQAALGSAFTPATGGGGEVLTGFGAAAFGDMVQSAYTEAAMLVELGWLDEAEIAINDARHMAELEPRVPRRWLVQLDLLEAKIQEKRDAPAVAVQTIDKAIGVERTLYSESTTEGRAQLALGRNLGKQDSNREALDAYRRGFEILAARGTGIDADRLMPYLAAAMRAAEGEPAEREALNAEMFEASQMARGTVAGQTMAQTAARLAADDKTVGTVVRKLQDARQRRDDLRRTQARAAGSTKTLAAQEKKLAASLAAIDKEIAELERQVQVASPRYNQLLDRPISAKETQSTLRAGEAIAQFLIGTNEGYGFLVQRDRIQVYPIALTRRQVEQRVRVLREPFESTAVPLPAYPVDDAHQLYRTLFGPVHEQIAGVRHLITVPSSALLSLPFGVLVTAPPPPISGYDYSKVPWMALRHGLTLAPSVQSFVNLRTTVKPSRAGKSFAGFGDFVPSGDGPGLLKSLSLPQSCAGEVNSIANASPLPDTATELRSVSRLLGGSPGDLITGRSFTVERLKRMSLDSYRIISFATHGLLPSKLRCLPEPALLTTRTGKDDGLLTSSEVATLSLDADLVVLSACDTGGPAGSGGEALTGLARSFFYAGARSLLVTHWDVPSRFTTDLLIGTFERAHAGASLAEALKQSQTRMIRTPISHPKGWAGFTVVGDGGQKIGR